MQLPIRGNRLGRHNLNLCEKHVQIINKSKRHTSKQSVVTTTAYEMLSDIQELHSHALYDRAHSIVNLNTGVEGWKLIARHQPRDDIAR